MTSTESAGSDVWASRAAPVAFLSAAAAQGTTTVALGPSGIPLVPWGDVMIGADHYQLRSVSGPQTGYTLTLTGGLDFSVGATTPVYYDGPAGDVTVAYLDISDDLHTTTGTISTGSGWTVEHNSINDSYGSPGQGVGLYGGDEGTIEYNCFSQLGDYAANVFGTGPVFDYNYNEVYETSYEPDPGCGCSGGGKWWGTLNADIVDNAFVYTSCYRHVLMET